MIQKPALVIVAVVPTRTLMCECNKLVPADPLPASVRCPACGRSAAAGDVLGEYRERMRDQVRH